MSRIRIRNQGNVPFTASQQEQLELNKGMVYRELYLRLTSQPTVTAANNSQANTLSAEQWGLLQRIEIVANHTQVIRAFTGEELWWLNYFWYGRSPQIDATLGDGATANPSLDNLLVLPFWIPQSVRPAETQLDARTLSALHIRVNWGTFTSINSAATAFTTDPVLNVHSMEAIGVRGPFNLWRQYRIQETISATNSERQTELRVGDIVYRGFLIHVQDAAVDQNDIINNVKLVSGTNVYVDVDGLVLQQLTPGRLGLETLVAHRSSSRALAGWYYLDLVTDGFMSEALDALTLAELYLELDVTVGAGATTLHVVPSTLLPLRGGNNGG